MYGTSCVLYGSPGHVISNSDLTLADTVDAVEANPLDTHDSSLNGYAPR
jgi:hypothetical protein